MGPHPPDDSGAALVLPVTQAQVVQRMGEDRDDAVAVFEGQHREDDDGCQDRDDQDDEQVLLRFHGISLLSNCPDAIKATAEAASMSV